MINNYSKTTPSPLENHESIPNLDIESDDGEEEDAEEETEIDDVDEEINPYHELKVRADELVCSDFLRQFEVKESRAQGKIFTSKSKVRSNFTHDSVK